MRLLRLASVLLAALPAVAGSKNDMEPWVAVDRSGKLAYRRLPTGDRIADFSYAGYGGGGVPLPTVPVLRTLAPSGGDDTALIQQAIDEISALPIQPGGFRGAVLLGPGVYLTTRTITIAASGVVLRGAGPRTSIKITGEPHTALVIQGDVHTHPAGPTLHIVQPYVPSGTSSLQLDDASTLAPGDTIRITRFTTPKWLHFMGMDVFNRPGRDEHWVGDKIASIHTIRQVQDNTIILDVPLTDSYDRTYLPPEGAEVVKVTQTGYVEHSGLESLHLFAPPVSTGFHDPLFQAALLRGVRDAWISNLIAVDTTEGFEMDKDTLRVTIQDTGLRHTRIVTSSAKPADFVLRGTQLLILRCAVTGNDRMYVITGPRNQGPNVVLGSDFTGDGRIQPHQRWSTGLLVDNTQVLHGGIDMLNRGELGSGHGWTMGWGVVWNSAASSLIIQNPPGAANWAIGTRGSFDRQPMRLAGARDRPAGPELPEGILQSKGVKVAPKSLYLEQLRERLGPSAAQALAPRPAQ